MLRTIGLGLLLGASGLAPAMADSVLAVRGELARNVRAYQEARDCQGVDGLFYTEGMDKSRKKAFTRTIRDVVCANFGRTIASIAFQSVDPARQQPSDVNGRHCVYTLEPRGAIVIDYGRGTQEAPKSLSFLYGMNDGKAYLITTKNADAR